MNAPRPTDWWKRQMPKVQASVKALFDDAELTRIFDLAVAFGVQADRIRRRTEQRAQDRAARGELGDAALLRHQGRKFVEEACPPAAQRFLDALVVAATSASPRLRHIYGEGGLRDFLVDLVVAVAVGDATGGYEAALKVLEATAPAALEHLPDNPISVVHESEDGALLLNVPPEATREHHMGVVSYEKSLQPAGKPGRPRKARKPKGPARPRISDAAIGDTKTLSVADWAAKHAPDLDLADKRQSKAAYARYDRASVHRRRRTP